jgi:hypothetical protein
MTEWRGSALEHLLWSKRAVGMELYGRAWAGRSRVRSDRVERQLLDRADVDDDAEVERDAARGRRPDDEALEPALDRPLDDVLPRRAELYRMRLPGRVDDLTAILPATAFPARVKCTA